ncbi:MAG: YceI family protein [Bacteroidales bacterium]|nr:YceI family protein [Bacteroidales bacterium]
MKTIMNRYISLAVFFLVSVSQAHSQMTYRIVPSNSKLTIHGTSSVHDWIMEADQFTCNLVFELDDMKVQNIADIQFSVAVKDIRSESNLMDKKAYNALKEDQSPYITFRQTALESLNSENGQATGKISGYLSVAGKTKQVVVPFTGKILTNNRISVSGIISLKMSDFNVEPPTAMLGVLKTDDAITLNYSFEFNPDLTSDR